jgi:hypothetical protein
MRTLYDDINRSTASAPELRRFFEVVRYLVRSLTPPSNELTLKYIVYNTVNIIFLRISCIYLALRDDTDYAIGAIVSSR